MTQQVLITCTVASFVESFLLDHVDILTRDLGCRLSVAANFEHGNTLPPSRVQAFRDRLESRGISTHHIDFSRVPRQLAAHTRAGRQLGRLLRVHSPGLVITHTPIAAAVTRVAARRAHIPVVYVAHGFHFYTGAGAAAWLAFYPVERLLARWTHDLVTINTDDARRAASFGATRTHYVPGVGIDTDVQPSLTPDEKRNLRRALGVPPEAFLLSAVGELNANKNHRLLIDALARLGKPDVHLVIAGEGPLRSSLTALAAQAGVEANVHLLGYRADVPRLLAGSDAFALPSRREGLSVALMEAMAAGIPIVCTRIRGNVDLVHHEVNGLLIEPDDVQLTAAAIGRLADEPETARRMGAAHERLLRRFTREPVRQRYTEIFRAALTDGA